MKKLSFLLLAAASMLAISGCTNTPKGGGNSSEEEDSSSSSIYTGPTDLFVAFFVDYNTADFDHPYYSYKTQQGQLLSRPPQEPTSADALDPAYPIFLGWSSHTVIDSDADLWDFNSDVVGLGERSYLYLYGIWVADEDIPMEENNYMMYRTGENAWAKQEMTLNPDNNNEYMLQGFTFAADTEVAFHLEDEWYHYSDLKNASKGEFEQSPAYLHEDGETYSDGNIIVKLAGDYDIYIDVSAAKDSKAAIYMATDTGEEQATKYQIVIAGVYYNTIHNENPQDPSFDEYYALNISCNAGDEMQTYDSENDALWTIATLDSFSQGWNKQGGKIICTESGAYDFYLKFKYQNDQVYIGRHA